MRNLLLILTGVCILSCRSPEARGPEDEAATDSAGALMMQSGGATDFPADSAEPRLANLRMLTHAGENAEAYFSADGEHLIFQANRPGVAACDQIFTMDIDGSNIRRVSNGEGRTTCAYYFPSGSRILYASTHASSRDCPPPPDYSQGYVWALYDFDIYTANPDGSDIRTLSSAPGYDAEATISRDGSRIVFTSVRDGDLDIYAMDADGGNVRRLTDEPGYDGGPFYSPDGTKIVYRAHHPTDSTELADYRRLLQGGLVRPTTLDIWVMNADGSGKRRVTSGAAASFAPFFHPSGEKIIFSSNMHDPQGRNFDLYLVNLDGTGLEQVTRHADFDGFPMFSPDGTKLVFASNRGAVTEGDTNIFIADWVGHIAPSMKP
jgi:Tol biopolymer transport system component